MDKLAMIVGMVCCLAALGVARGASTGGCTVTLDPSDDVQRAIDGLPADAPDARVCLGSGAFRLRRFVAIERDGVTLRGEGASTVLQLDGGVQSPVVVVGDYGDATPRHPTSRVTIERLRIVGGGRGGSEHDPERPYLTNSAVVVRAGRGIAIRDLDVTGCRSACILTERETDDVSIERNRIRGATWDGLSLNRTVRARVADNEIRDNTAAGITLEHLEDSVVERNLVRGNGTHGIYFADSHRNRVVGNRFIGNVLSGVFLTCAVRTRTPVGCWKDSFSQGNTFDANQFTANRVAFTVAADAGANCVAPTFVVNRSARDVFADNPRDEPYPGAYGRCLVIGGGGPRIEASEG
jgi:parallel beta-helix repeat protein